MGRAPGWPSTKMDNLSVKFWRRIKRKKKGRRRNLKVNWKKRNK